MMAKGPVLASAGGSAGAALLPLFVTAVLTLAIALTVQLYIVPRVETRKRREDRWERDVLTLGEMLTLEFPQAASKLSSDATGAHMLMMMKDHLTSENLQKHSADLEASFKEARQTYDQLLNRVDWLVDRIGSLDPYDEALCSLKMKLHPLKQFASGLKVEMLVLHPYPPDSPMYAPPGHPRHIPNDMDKVDALSRRSVDAQKEMVDILKSLASASPPRRSIISRVYRRFW